MNPIRYCYSTIEFGDSDIHICTLRDKQQFHDNNDIAADLGISSANWPLFGVIWDSSKVLANFMFEYEINDKRILEVGCGIALTSLMLNQRNADITSTDYHPEVGRFLSKNVKLNKGRKIPFIRTGWADEESNLGKFDVIIGSDLLYESEHVDLLSEFIHQHTQTKCEIIIVDPGRGNHARFSKKMITLGYSHSQNKPENISYLTKPFKGQILRYQRENL